MKKAIRIIIPIVLVLAIIVCIGWYLFIYDREFTRDVLLSSARYFENKGNRSVSTWFYNLAYKQADDNDAVAIELAEQYKESGNYTKAERTLKQAIEDGGGVDLYIALCKTFVEQDKLISAVNFLDNVSNQAIKEQLDMLRPAAPTCSPEPNSVGSYYTEYITVTISAQKGTLYANGNGEFPSVEKDLYKNGITLKDGINLIYSVAITEEGLVSPISFFRFIVGGVVEQVAFSDAAIEAAYREILGVSTEKTIYTDDLFTIKEFTVPQQATNLQDLRHLAFLEKLTVDMQLSGQLSNIAQLSNLKELIVQDTSVSAEELAVIGRLPNLEKLTLTGCSLSTTAGLESLAKLTYLNLSNNAIRNIEPLAKLQKLQEINLSHNALNDLTALSSLQSLTALDVSFNSLDTLSPIASVTSLKKLTAGNNSLKDIAGFERLTALTHLDLANNAIASIAPLSACTELENLNVSYNSLTDISVLANLNKLVDLEFTNNKVTSIPEWKTDCELVNIDGSYNEISTLEPLAGLKKLNNVSMDYNKGISSVKALANCPVLIQVNVYGTRVTNVSALTSQSVVVNYDPTR